MEECIFCKIIKKEIPSEIVFEDKDFLAFKDNNPKTKTHILIIPKKHISSIKEMEDLDAEIIGKLILRAKKIAKNLSLSGYKLLFNVGKSGGQIIFHIHLHLMSNE